MVISLGIGTSIEFFTEEFHTLNLKDKRLKIESVYCCKVL